MIKKINEINQSDIELHNRQKTLLCNQHKDKLIEFHCTNCDKFVCCSCYILSHNKHNCVSIEDADVSLLAQLHDSEKKLETSKNIKEEKIKAVQLNKEKLENHKHKLLDSVKMLINNFKEKLKIEYEKIIEKIDECFMQVTTLIVEKTDEGRKEYDKFLMETQSKLQSLQEAISLIKKHASPSSTPIERASLLKDNSITQLNTKLEDTNDHPNYQVLDISQWKADMNDWLQSLTKILSNIKIIPQINSKDFTITSRFVFARTEFMYY